MTPLPEFHQAAQPAWHILQISGPLDVEFASAMAELAPVTAWEPQRKLAPWFFGNEAPLLHEKAGNNFTTRAFPLLRGYAKPGLASIARTGPQLAKLIGAHANVKDGDVLVCTVPYFAPVAELWPGPVVYWLTDLITHYPSSKGIDVVALDKRMCKVATLLCPNSTRLRDYLIDKAGADPDRILIVPNATRKMNVYPSVPTEPAPLPKAARNPTRPVAGIIGNLAGNMDWLLLDETTRRTPNIQWLFVGPTDMSIPDAAHREARERVMARENSRFVGRQAYGDLVHYARSFDVAILPYLNCEPTYSGSSTRFYEHLAACRPMFATRSFEELLHKEPYLTLVDNADDLVDGMNRLAAVNFDDGYIPLRWKASQTETWQARSTAVFNRLDAELRKQATAGLPRKRVQPATRIAEDAMQAVG